MSTSNRGKKWEAEIGIALKAANSVKLNQNSLHGACDWISIYQGFGVIIEAKEVHEGRLAFSAITEREHKELTNLTARGGLGLVAICWRQTTTSKAWAIPWKDWCHVEITSVRKSLDLKNPHPLLIPLAKFNRPHGLGKAWDFRPILNRYLQEWAEKICREGIPS